MIICQFFLINVGLLMIMSIFYKCWSINDHLSIFLNKCWSINDHLSNFFNKCWSVNDYLSIFYKCWSINDHLSNFLNKCWSINDHLSNFLNKCWSVNDYLSIFYKCWSINDHLSIFLSYVKLCNSELWQMASSWAIYFGGVLWIHHTPACMQMSKKKGNKYSCLQNCPVKVRLVTQKHKLTNSSFYMLYI